MALAIGMIVGLTTTASAQTELNIRPISFITGFINFGLETPISEKATFLVDAGYGAYFYAFENPESILTTGMIGTRLYRQEDHLGLYLTTRARYRYYNGRNESGGNISIMAGNKWDYDNFLTIAAEIGLGYQGFSGEYNLLPTYAITVGFPLK